MANDNRYTAEQLAQLAGVSLRTVRYYVQEELIDRPLARGPGAHFSDAHLGQLRRCKLLQDWGFDLETIRDKSSSFQGVLEGFAFDAHHMRHGATIRELFKALGGEQSDRLTPKQAEALKAAVFRLRGRQSKSPPEKTTGREVIPMADGIDLVVDLSAYEMPSPKTLVEIALLIRKSFDPHRNEDDDE